MCVDGAVGTHTVGRTRVPGWMPARSAGTPALCAAVTAPTTRQTRATRLHRELEFNLSGYSRKSLKPVVKLMIKRPVPGPKERQKWQKSGKITTFLLFLPLWPLLSISRVISPKSETSTARNDLEKCQK